jgi:hypothetical protein
MDYDDVVTILRPKKGTLGAGGSAAVWEQVLDEDDAPVEVECAFEERGRRLVNERGAEVQTDATMNFRGNDPAALEKGDVVVFDGRAFEILDLQKPRLRGSSGHYAQAGLKLRKDLPQAVSP